MNANIILAEKALLGALLRSADAFWQVSNRLRAEHFSQDFHQQVFTVISDICSEGKRLAGPLVASRLPVDPGGQPIQVTLSILLAEGEEAETPLDFVDDVIGAWQEREFAKAAEFARTLVGRKTKDISAKASELQSKLEAIQDNAAEAHTKTFGEAAKRSIDRTQANYQLKGKAKIGIETGISELDEIVGPITPPSIVTLMAPSGHGKTALAVQIMRAASEQTIINVPKASLFASMEMRAEQIAQRVLAADSGISTRKQTVGDVTSEDIEILLGWSNYLNNLPITIDDRGRMTAREIANAARRAKRVNKIEILTVDHLKLLKPDKDTWTIPQTIENSQAIFQDLAKELDLVIIQLAQITREGQKRDGWRPREQDLFGGETVKEASDFLVAAVQPHAWLKQNEPRDEGERSKAARDEWQRQIAKWENKAEIGALKIRSGLAGEWREMPFDGQRMLFGSKAVHGQ